MTVIIKIIAISVVCVVASIILKQIKPEFAILITIIGSLAILFLVRPTGPLAEKVTKKREDRLYGVT